MLPLAAIRELENDPEHLALSILTMRAFARAKELYDQASKSKTKIDLPNTRIMKMVKDIDFDDAEEAMGIAGERGASDDGDS